VALVAWMWTEDVRAGWSAAYGSLAVVVPAALFAYGRFAPEGVCLARAAMVGFFGLGSSQDRADVALLAAAPRLVPGLSWLALVAGMVITMKTYWVALMVRPGVRKTD
jgi:ATP synthase protein I